MGSVLLVAFLVVPVVEIAVFARVANEIGIGNALLAVIAVSMAGAWLVKREGLQVWRQANQRMAAGELPTDELVNGVLVLFAGALLLTPGFLSDVFGLLLLLPLTRSVFRRALRRRLRVGPIVVGGFAPGRGARGDVWDVDGWEDPPDRPALP